MTNYQKKEIVRLQQEGAGYRIIAEQLGLSFECVKSWCRRHPIQGVVPGRCLQCGATLLQLPHKKQRRFCSDACRNAWWSAHPERKQTKTEYSHTCACCGREFRNNRITASYCGRACFAQARRKGGADG